MSKQPRELTHIERERLFASMQLLQTVVQRPHGPRSVRAMQASGFDGHGLDPRDAKHLTSCDHRKLNVYRKLIRGTMLDTMRLELPLTAARLGDDYDHWVHRFCNEQLPSSAILRDVAFEFAAWACPLWQHDDSIPPFLPELARYELLEFDVHCAQRVAPARVGDALRPELPVCFDGSVRLGHFTFEVHLLPDDPQDRTQPKRASDEDGIGVLAYRDGDNDFRQLSLTPLAARSRAISPPSRRRCAESTSRGPLSTGGRRRRARKRWRRTARPRG